MSTLFDRILSTHLRRDLLEIAASVDASEPSWVKDALLLRARLEMQRSFGPSETLEAWFRAVESDGASESEARRQVFEAVRDLV